MSALPDGHYGGTEWQETAEMKAQRILCEELRQRGWDLQELKKRRKGDPDKIEIARRLRSIEVVTVPDAGRRLLIKSGG